jgi:hypothetical protein
MGEVSEPSNVVVPCTTSFGLSEGGLIVLSKRDPEELKVSNVLPVDEAMAKGFLVLVPWINNVVALVVVPMPTLAPLVAKNVESKTVRVVVVALVTREEVAKTFWEKRLRKRRELEPRERVVSVVGRISARTLRVL